MVNYCCVVGCNSKSRDAKDPNAPIFRLFGFPKYLSARWRLVTKQPAGWLPTKSHRICELHFKKSDVANRYLPSDAEP